MAAPPAEPPVSTGRAAANAKLPVISKHPHAHGTITPESNGQMTLPRAGSIVMDILYGPWPGWDPFREATWTGVVTAQLRMTNLSEIWEDVQSYQGAHLALIQDIINKEGGEKKLKSYQVPVICVRVPGLEDGSPAPRRRNCSDVLLAHDDPLVLHQRKYIGLGSFAARQSLPLIPVGSTVKISCDNDYFYETEGKYNGYFTEVITLNQVRTLQIHSDCPVDSAKGKFDGKKEPQGLPGTEEKSAKAEPEKEGWFSKNQPKGKDGQRALNRGGVVDFAKNFWDSASESFGGGEDSSGEALIGQERTQSLRSQKPSNQ